VQGCKPGVFFKPEFTGFKGTVVFLGGHFLTSSDTFAVGRIVHLRHIVKNRTTWIAASGGQRGPVTMAIPDVAILVARFSSNTVHPYKQYNRLHCQQLLCAAWQKNLSGALTER